MDLVARHRDQVGAFGDRYPAQSLHRVAQHQGAGVVRDPRNLADRLDHADLIVDQHRRDQQRPGVDRLLDQVEIDQPVWPDRQADDLEAPPFEPFERIEHRGMLGRRRDDAVAPGSALFSSPLERPVERLRSRPK